MTPDHLQILGMIALLPPEHQAEVKRLAEAIRALTKDEQGLGVIAMALVGVEIQEESKA